MLFIASWIIGSSACFWRGIYHSPCPPLDDRRPRTPDHPRKFLRHHRLVSSAVVASRNKLLKDAPPTVFICTTPHASNKTQLMNITQLVPPDESVSLVANGGSAHKDRKLIESSRWVVRFNDFVVNPYVGRRIDLHFVNGHPACNPNAKLMIRIECVARYKNVLHTCPGHVRECITTPQGLDRMCSGDASRGFMALALLNRSNMKLFGFSRNTHYYERKTRVWHNVEIEHNVMASHKMKTFD